MKVTAVILPVASVMLLYLWRMSELNTKRDTVAGVVKEGLTLRLFVLVGSLMLAGSLAEFFLCKRSLHWLTFLLGWSCALASVAIRRRAIAALGQFWSLHVEIREDHQLVQTGPFRWVRHPTYLSMILELVALGMILNAAYCVAIVWLVFVPILVWRIRLEEAALVEKFGDRYRSYQRRTPALFPFRRPQL
jgi:protein-S-isoprenylcysteine O-methyltransferase Ste14